MHCQAKVESTWHCRVPVGPWSGHGGALVQPGRGSRGHSMASGDCGMARCGLADALIHPPTPKSIQIKGRSSGRAGVWSEAAAEAKPSCTVQARPWPRGCRQRCGAITQALPGKGRPEAMSYQRAGLGALPSRTRKLEQREAMHAVVSPVTQPSAAGLGVPSQLRCRIIGPRTSVSPTWQPARRLRVRAAHPSMGVLVRPFSSFSRSRRHNRAPH